MLLYFFSLIVQGFFYAFGAVIAFFAVGIAGGAFEEWRNRRFERFWKNASRN